MTLERLRNMVADRRLHHAAYYSAGKTRALWEGLYLYSRTEVKPWHKQSGFIPRKRADLDAACVILRSAGYGFPVYTGIKPEGIK